MSGYVLIYNQAGVNPAFLSSAYEQIKDLIDDRSYRIEYFSLAPTAIDDSRSNPVRLFVIPGGIYTQMADELKPLAPRIRKLINEDGASYLGLCAGAIAASSRLLMPAERLVPYESNPPLQQIAETPILQGRLHLQLYPGDCCFLDVLDAGLYGIQQVRKVSPELKKETYQLYFQLGVFFPSAEEPDARPLLEYPAYKFSGYDPEINPRKTYQNITPLAAVTQKAGKGRLLLSGVHPEIGPKVVQEFPVRDIAQEEAKKKTIPPLVDSKAAQIDTMRDFLNTLSIVTKKV